MKVLHVSTFDSGGAFQAAYNLHLGLLAKGHNSSILVLYKQSSQLQEVYSFLDSRNLILKVKDSFNYRIFQIKKKQGIRGKPKVLFSYASSPYDISRHPLFLSADVINLHWIASFLDYPSFFRKVDKPIFWTLHDMNPFSGGFHFLSYQINSYSDLDKRVIKQKEAALNYAKNLQIVAPSRWLFEVSKDSNLFKKFIHHYINNGLDTSKFKVIDKKEAREQLGLPLEKQIILFVSDAINDRRKGIHLLLQALSTLTDLENVLLITVGSGQIGKIDIPHRSMGFVSDQKKMAYIYSSADVYVIPSIEDNLPNTVMESLTCGTAVIGFKVGGIPDMVIDGFNGILVEGQNAEHLSRSIREFLKKPKEYNNLIIKEDAVKRFDLRLQAEKYIKLYQKELKQETL